MVQLVHESKQASHPATSPGRWDNPVDSHQKPRETREYEEERDRHPHGQDQGRHEHPPFRVAGEQVASGDEQDDKKQGHEVEQEADREGGNTGSTRHVVATVQQREVAQLTQARGQKVHKHVPRQRHREQVFHAGHQVLTGRREQHAVATGTEHRLPQGTQSISQREERATVREHLEQPGATRARTALGNQAEHQAQGQGRNRGREEQPAHMTG